MTVEERQAVEGAIVEAVLDYFEGWFDGDAARVERAHPPRHAHPSLAQVCRTRDEKTAEGIMDAPARGLGRERDPGDRQIEVEIEDVYGTIANATVRSAVYREYVHLVRTPEGWKIVNALWELT